MTVPRVPWAGLLLVWAVLFAGPAWNYLPVLIDNPWGIIQDDGRHFVAWLRALQDPALFAQDPMAQFFRSVTSDLYEALFLPAIWLGIDVVAWHMIVLMPGVAFLSLLALERFIAVFEPDLALRFAILVVMAAFAHAFYVHGLPRDFALPILCLALFAYATERIKLMGLVMGLGAAIYPAAAITVGLGVGLREVYRLFTERSWTRKSNTVVVAAAAGAAGLLFFMSGSSGTGETFTIAEARGVAIFQDGARTSYFEGSSDLERITCGHRAGLFSDCVPGPLWWLTVPIMAALIVGTLAFLARHRQGDWRMLASLCLAGLILFSGATLLAFELHLPSRYARWSVQFVAIFGLAIFLSLGVARVLAALKAPRGLAPFLFGAIVAAAAPNELTRLYGIEVDTAPEVSRTLRDMPPDVVVAGVARQIDNIPAFAGRSVLAALELSVPYKKDYHAEMARRVALLNALWSEMDPVAWRALHEASGVDFYLLADPDMADRDRAARPLNWAASFEDAPAAGGSTIFSSHPEAVAACIRSDDGAFRLLDGHCFAERLAE